MKFLRNLLASLLALFIFCLLGALTIGAIVGSATVKKPMVLNEPSVLQMKLSSPINDISSSDPLENFDLSTMKINKPINTYGVLQNIEKAKGDDNIKGIFLDLTGIGASMAAVEEIRNALLDFKSSGKFIYTYSATLSQKAYYLATVSDKIFLNPEGMLEFYGLSSNVSFYTQALKNIGVEMQVIRHGKFKSAVEPFMLDEMSDASREQTQAFLSSFWNHMINGISEARNLSAEQLNAIADGMLATAGGDALEQKMVDVLAYRDEVNDAMKVALGLESSEKVPFISLGKYQKVKSDKKLDIKNRIAVIYAEGAIESGIMPGESGGIQSASLVKEIRKARESDRIKAIVLRVNSPGGSALASDIIWRELELCKGVKPLIVSMGGVAASGGYYIACNADAIVASPTTITGSIGVFGLVPNLNGLVEKKMGVTSSTVKTNEMADFGNLTRALNPAERAFLQLNVERTYDTFITKVAKGRNMSKEAVDAIGQGRVWSGEKAIEIGLIDKLGGLEDAIALAAEKAELESYSIKSYPEFKDPLEELLQGLGEDMSASMLEKAMGEQYQYVKTMREAMQIRGVQARLPYNIDIR
ncbi:MAG: protease-4 [Flavobacteriales bacterium]|jgi:protease-4